MPPDNQPSAPQPSEMTGEFQPVSAASDAEKAGGHTDPGTFEETGAFIPGPVAAPETGAWQISPAARSSPTSIRSVAVATSAEPPPDETRAYTPDSSAGTRGTAKTDARSVEATARIAPDHDAPLPPMMGGGRFLLKRFHAKGGMGEVWLAEDCDIGRQVALKKVRTGRESHRDMFLQEARITGQLEHPGVIPVHELGLDDNSQPFYVMKFVHGRTLKEAIEEYHGPRAAGREAREVERLRLLNIFVDLCHTIAYAHSRGVIHRDVKPENVMVGAYGETLVLDWGLAKVLGAPENADPSQQIGLSFSGSMATAAGAIKGTPSYMAPEATTGQTEDVDRQSDIFLLGGTLYHILTGHPPRHTKKNITELLELVKTPPTPPRKLDPTIPRPLDAICQKALALRKQDRYQTAAALAEDLQRHLAGEPVTAYQETWTERTWRWCKRHHRLLGRTAAAAAILALLAFGAVKWREFERRQDQERQHRFRAEQLAKELQDQDRARGESNEFRRLADEARFYAAHADPAGENAPFFDLRKGDATGQAALAVTAAWGPRLEQFPLASERDPLKGELYDLLLLLAQVKTRQGDDAATARNVLALLDRAAPLRDLTQGYHRLRHAALQGLGEPEKAAVEKGVADDPKTPAAALDHFLLGEQRRAEAIRPSDGKDSRKQWQLNLEKLEEAVGLYRKALSADPDHYWSHLQIGRCYLSLGRQAEAVEALGTCVALRSQAPWGYSARGLALTLQKRYDEARADLDRAVALAPDLGPPRLNRAVLFAQQEQYDAALADLDTVLRAPPDRRLIEATFFRGQIFMKKGDFAKALEEFDQVVAAKRFIGPLHRLRAHIHLFMANNQEALADLDAFLGQGQPFDSASASAHAQRGRQLHLLALELPQARQKDTLLLALNQLEKAEKLRGSSALLFDELGGVRERLGRIGEAIQAYTRALEINLKDARVLVKRGWAYEKLEPPKYAEAQNDFAAALRLEPMHAEAHTGLGYIQACRQRDAGARREAGQAILHGGGDYLILHNVACIYAKLAQTDAQRTVEYEDLALDHLRRGVELWRKGGTGPSAVELIQVEPAFAPSLRDRPEFQELLKNG
jgi:tetratricopeptide (TPR) repeat protein/predicted Ser/Thr protein kinase